MEIFLSYETGYLMVGLPGVVDHAYPSFAKTDPSFSTLVSEEVPRIRSKVLPLLFKI